MIKLVYNAQYEYTDMYSDNDMYLFFEKGVKAWVPYISKRRSEPKNKYLKSYDLT